MVKNYFQLGHRTGLWKYFIIFEAQMEKTMTNAKAPKLKPINLRALFKEKNPKVASLLPGFVFRYINRIAHIDECNEIIKNYGDQEGVEFADSVVRHFNVDEQVVNIENVPTSGRYIFVANHPLGGFDALLLVRNVSKRIGDLRFLVNDLLMKITPLAPIFIPINKHGGHSRRAAQLIEETYESDKQILIFPAGLASRRIKGRIIDTEWKKHFVQKAVQHKRDVIPVHISGRNSKFFYNLSNTRKFLGIPWNLEMFYLSDETFKHKGDQLTLTFGKPIPYQTFDRSKNAADWAQYVKDILYELPNRTKQ